MDKRTFAFLKSRKIFTKGGGGKVTLQEALTRLESNREYKDRARHPRKKAKAR